MTPCAPVSRRSGGNKKVGHQFWPELSADKAGEKLADCLNRQRPQKLDPEQVLLLLVQARQVNCHAGMFFIADHCDYERPKPVEPDNEFAQLQRDYIQSVKLQQQLAKRMEHMLSLREVG